MKTMLQGMARQITLAEYQEVEDFLDTFAAEAQERADRCATASPEAVPLSRVSTACLAASSGTPPFCGKSREQFPDSLSYLCARTHAYPAGRVPA
jgi:hypothetical protein